MTAVCIQALLLCVFVVAARCRGDSSASSVFQYQIAAGHKTRANRFPQRAPKWTRGMTIRGGKLHSANTLEALEELVQGAGNSLVVLDFSASWCGPCKVIAPVLHALAEEHKDLVVIEIDVDENEDAAQQYDVSQMPTFVLLRKGKVVDRFSGASAAVLREKILDQAPITKAKNEPNQTHADHRAGQQVLNSRRSTVVQTADVDDSQENQMSGDDAASAPTC